jgi:hypothetical protein
MTGDVQHRGRGDQGRRGRADAGRAGACVRRPGEGHHWLELRAEAVEAHAAPEEPARQAATGQGQQEAEPMTTPLDKTAREIELEHHIKVLRLALQDAPHSSTMPTYYESWYREQRGPALDSTDTDRWKKYE